MWGLPRCCGPIALMTLLGLPCRAAVGACSVAGSYRGHLGRRGTKVKKAIERLGLGLEPVEFPSIRSYGTGEVSRIVQWLRDNWGSEGRYIVLSKRKGRSGRSIGHVSTVRDGKLLDSTERDKKIRRRITGVYRVDGDFEAAKAKAKSLSLSIKPSVQPVGRRKIRSLSRLVFKHHYLPTDYELCTFDTEGRKRRNDRKVLFRPLVLKRQRRVNSRSNVRRFLDMLTEVFDVAGDGPPLHLVDRDGCRVHGNTRIGTIRSIEGLATRARGRPRRRSSRCGRQTSLTT